MDLRELLATVPGEHDTTSLLARLDTLESAKRQLAATELAVLAELDRRQAWKVDGALSLADWVEHRTGCSRGSAFRTALVAEHLTDLPATAEALAAGHITTDHAVALASAITPATVNQVRANEQSLVDRAKDQTADQTQKTADRARLRFTPDTTEPLSEKQRRQRGFTITHHRDGMATANITYDPENRQRCETILEPVIKAMAHADAEQNRQQATKPDPTFVRRTAAQRRFDAHMHLLSLGQQARTDTTARGAGPAEIITILREDSYGRLQASYPDGTPVHPTTVERLGCSARHTRIVLDAEDREINLGTVSRVPSRTIRLALLARDSGCRFPGCNRPHSWTHAHHLVFVEHGGETSLENLTSLCTRHHHAVHEGGYRVRRLASGELEFARPDGSHLATVPYQRIADDPVGEGTKPSSSADGAFPAQGEQLELTA